MNAVIDFKIKNNSEEIIKTNIDAKYEKDKILEFNYDNESIKIEFKNNNIIMNKENDESIITFDFKPNIKTESKYYIKNLDFYIDSEIFTKIIEIKNNKINIEYDLKLSGENVGSFKYELNIKEVI